MKIDENINYCKSGISKKDGCRYKSQYIQHELPDDPKNLLTYVPGEYQMKIKGNTKGKLIKDGCEENILV